MVAWWYVENDQQTGPIELDELTQLLRSGRIGPDTLLWRDGMDGWYPLRDVEELSALRVPVPPPLPTHPAPAPPPYASLLAPPPAEPGLPRPSSADRGPRFLARMFDVWFEIVLVSFPIGVVLGLTSTAVLQMFNDSTTAQVMGILFLPIALALDAVIYRVAGNTPGKALVGLKVLAADGSPLTLSQYLHRNFSMWLRGLGLGIPIVNLFAMAIQARRLSKGEPASYDEADRFQMRVTPTGNWRKLAFVVALILLGAVAFNRNTFMASVAPDYSWQNPLTQLTATINPNWKNSVQTNADGQQVYTFNELTDRAVVILAREEVPGFSLGRYVGAYKISTAANMRFSDDGRYVSKDGRQVWQGTGSMTDNVSNRLNVEVIETGTGFWRLITIQTGPPVATDALVTQLHSALSNTIK